MLLDRNIALIGFMTAGKTQVGAALARRTGLPFLDIDLLVEGLERAPIHQIFREKGEPYFRSIEALVLRDLCRGAGQIIGCGGGTILDPENRRVIRERCISVWLRVSGTEVIERLARPGSPHRPLLDGLDARKVVPELLRSREPLYGEADHRVDTEGRDVDEIAREIAILLGLPEFPE